MKLLTPELLASLPPLCSQEKVPDPVVHAKFFTADSNWTWYVTEGEADGDSTEMISVSSATSAAWRRNGDTSSCPSLSRPADRWGLRSSAISILSRCLSRRSRPWSAATLIADDRHSYRCSGSTGSERGAVGQNRAVSPSVLNPI
jgi:hypothetical protein